MNYWRNGARGRLNGGILTFLTLANTENRAYFVYVTQRQETKCNAK